MVSSDRPAFPSRPVSRPFGRRERVHPTRSLRTLGDDDPLRLDRNIGSRRDSQRIRTALGLHPQLAHERKSELALFDALLPKTDYVGEIGLDGSPEYRPHWNDQVAV